MSARKPPPLAGEVASERKRGEPEGGSVAASSLHRFAVPPPPQAGEDFRQPVHCLIVTLPMSVRAWMPGAYMSSTTPAGSTKVPAVTALAT